MKMKIYKIEVLLEHGWIELIDGKYGDIEVKMDDEKIKFSNIKTPVFKIRLTAKNDYFDDALILGDAWERAYGELEWKKPNEERVLPWYFLAHDKAQTYGFGVKTQPNAMCYWQCTDDTIVLTTDVRNGSQGLVLDGKCLEVCRVVTAEYTDDIYTSAAKFCRLMCDNPRFPQTPIFGGNDWYCNYGENSFDKILQHTERIAECAEGLVHTPYMVIDDGWQICHYPGKDNEYYNGGPWDLPNYNFVDMKKMAESISDLGVIPGIWFRPLLTIEKISPNMLLHDGGIRRYLDPSDADVLALVKRDVERIKNWGYKLIKHDFSTFDIFGQYGASMGSGIYAREVIFKDKEKTTAQIIKNFYRTIRDAAGEDVLIMGCNTVSHLSAGFFDIQRTGDDTSGFEWERTKKYGINTLAFRMSQHKKFYCVDADCVGVTENVDFAKNAQWLDVLAKSGTPLFVSIAENCFTDEVKSKITEAFTYADKNPKTSRPLDWLETRIPTKWASDFGVDEYNW